MRLSFHQRILLILICLGAIPTAAGDRGLGPYDPDGDPGRRPAGSAGGSGRDRPCAAPRPSTRRDLSPGERDALAAHAATLNSAIGRFQRVETFGRYYYAGLGTRGVPGWRGVPVRVGAARRTPVASAEPSDRGAHRLDRDTSARIEPLPPDRPRRGRPRVRGAAHGAPGDGDRARREAGPEAIEAERLRAFRETARRVAHEMKNPLTPIRLAVAQLSRSPSALDPRGDRGAHRRSRAGWSSWRGSSPSSVGCPRDRRRRWTSCELLEELARTLACRRA